MEGWSKNEFALGKAPNSSGVREGEMELTVWDSSLRIEER